MCVTAACSTHCSTTIPCPLFRCTQVNVTAGSCPSQPRPSPQRIVLCTHKISCFSDRTSHFSRRQLRTIVAFYSAFLRYPDYDPPRRGAEFGEVVAALQREKVYTFPYINGRIFDNNSASFKTEDGVSRVVKQALAPRFGAVGPLLECKESYGSEELDGDLVYFDVADPSTSYWQDKYAGQVSRLVNLSGVSGVYIDQLAAGAPLADWTPRPEHGVGGGAWWRKGLMRLLNQAHTVSMVDGAWSPLVVESNAEFLMDAANGLLTLAAFDAPFAPPDIPTPGASVFSPAFPAVYGGYFVGFGSIFTHNDLALNPDVFASRLAASFVWGIQVRPRFRFGSGSASSGVCWSRAGDRKMSVNAPNIF